MKRSKAFAVVAALCLAAAGCGGDDSADDTAPRTDPAGATTAGSSPTASTDPAGATTAGSSPTVSGPATGEPIRIGTFTSPSNLPAITAGAEAAIAAINAAGGVQGRPLELATCDNENDPNKAAACAQQMADDDSVVATVGVISVFGGDTNPILERAGLAGVGTSVATPGDYDSPVVFTTNITTLTSMGASAALYDQLGATKQGLAMVDSPAGVTQGNLINDYALSPRGTSLAATAVVPLTSADVNPQAVALLSSDGVYLGLTTDLAIRFAQALRQQGFEGPVVVSASQLGAGLVAESLSGMTDDLYAIGGFDRASDGYATMLAEADANGADPVLLNDTFATAWLAVHTFADVANDLQTIDRPSVLAAMQNLSDYDTRGLLAEPLNYTIDGDVFDGGAPNIIPAVQYVFLFKYEDGEWVRFNDEPQSVFETP